MGITTKLGLGKAIALNNIQYDKTLKIKNETTSNLRT